jgi:hypothetical protein
MANDVPIHREGETEQDSSDLLAETDALAKRVERMVDGPRKAKLTAALAEIRALIGATPSEARRGN